MRIARYNSAHNLKLSSIFNGVVITYVNNTKYTQTLRWSQSTIPVEPGQSVSERFPEPWSVPAPKVNQGYFIVERYIYGALVSRLETDLTGKRVQQCVEALNSILPLKVSDWPSDMAVHYDSAMEKGMVTGTCWRFKNMDSRSPFLTVACVLVGFRSGLPGVFLITNVGSVFWLYGNPVINGVAPYMNIEWLEGC